MKSNLNSLLVLFRSNDLTVLTTGDAVKTTYERSLIHTQYLSEYFPCSILQASHHGAGTDGSTSDWLLSQTQPSCGVISAPLYSVHEHPTFETIDTFIRHLSQKEKDSQMHLLSSN